MLEKLVEGKDTADLAQELEITYATARTHIQNLLTKLGVHSKLELVAFAVEQQIVAVPSHDDSATVGAGSVARLVSDPRRSLTTGGSRNRRTRVQRRSGCPITPDRRGCNHVGDEPAPPPSRQVPILVVRAVGAGPRSSHCVRTGSSGEVFRSFIIRRINVRYKQASVGIGWAVLQPMLAACDLRRVLRPSREGPERWRPLPAVRVGRHRGVGLLLERGQSRHGEPRDRPGALEEGVLPARDPAAVGGRRRIPRPRGRDAHPHRGGRASTGSDRPSRGSRSRSRCSS